MGTTGGYRLLAYPRGYDRGFGAVILIFQPTFASYLCVMRLYGTNNDKVRLYFVGEETLRNKIQGG